MSVSIFPFPEEPGPFSFVAWIATFYYPWLGGFFEFVFSEGPRPFFLCSLKSYVLLPVVRWIFWICFTQRTELWVYGEFEFFKFSSATFLLPVVGWIFWICFLGRPETFFTFDCSLNCCILLPLVGSIFPFCLFSVDLGSLFCWKLEFLFCCYTQNWVDWLNDLIKLVVIRIICFI